ncbi:biogenesis of lysosome-related organelles complex 1 subunit 5-like [Lineus longissimus]|uniref:biogenesis of lysosome-related organelles complex 1 subunit 5-like n=1 Tax=Lineus longissimus TaxID=88925 RepID=UPI002B4CA8D6
MYMDVILKDVSGIYSRLLDHRPVLNGEIRFMLKEFEEKRSDREGSRLRKAMVDSSEVEKDILPQTLEELKQNLGVLLEKANACNKLTEDIAKVEDQKNSEWLTQQRAARDKDWQQFMQEQCEKSKNVDQSFQEEKEKLESQYAELETKLSMPPSP